MNKGGNIDMIKLFIYVITFKKCVFKLSIYVIAFWKWVFKEDLKHQK